MKVSTIIVGVLVLAAFFFRDANPIGSAIVIGLIMLGGTAHLLRQQGWPNHNLRWGVIRNILCGPIWLLMVEWLSIAIIAHFVTTNDPFMPYERLCKWISCSFTCYRKAYFL